MMTLRRLGSWTLAIGVLAVAGTPALAQGPRGGGFGFGSTSLLMAPNVQKELKLSDEQSGKLRDVLRSVRAKHESEFTSARDLPENERGPKMREIGKTIDEEVKKELALSDEQSKRLDQIRVQQRAYEAMLEPEVQSKLNLSDDQKDKLREIVRDTREKTQSLRAAQGGPETFQKINDIRKESNEKAVALLTDDQKKTWKELTGEPVEVRFERRPNN